MVSRRAVITGIAGLPFVLASGDAISEIPKKPPFYPVPKVSPSPPEQQEQEMVPKEYVGGKVQEYHGGSRLGPEIGLVDYLAQQNSRVALLAFGFAGCVPCLAEKPYLNGIWKKYKEKGLAVVGVEIQALWYLKNDGADKMFLHLDQFVRGSSLFLPPDQPTDRDREYIAQYPIVAWLDERDSPDIYGAGLRKYERNSYPHLFLLPRNGEEVREGRPKLTDLAPLLHKRQGQQQLEQMIEQALSSSKKGIR